LFVIYFKNFHTMRAVYPKSVRISRIVRSGWGRVSGLGFSARN
jgi:hypothetical protein